MVKTSKGCGSKNLSVKASPINPPAVAKGTVNIITIGYKKLPNNAAINKYTITSARIKFILNIPIVSVNLSAVPLIPISTLSDIFPSFFMPSMAPSKIPIVS